jgi:hypothetical protein
MPWIFPFLQKNTKKEEIIRKHFLPKEKELLHFCRKTLGRNN